MIQHIFYFMHDFLRQIYMLEMFYNNYPCLLLAVIFLDFILSYKKSLFPFYKRYQLTISLNTPTIILVFLFLTNEPFQISSYPQKNTKW